MTPPTNLEPGEMIELREKVARIVRQPFHDHSIPARSRSETAADAVHALYRPSLDAKDERIGWLERQIEGHDALHAQSDARLAAKDGEIARLNEQLRIERKAAEIAEQLASQNAFAYAAVESRLQAAEGVLREIRFRAAKAFSTELVIEVRDLCDAFLASSPEEAGQSGSGWRPIETAPKDGTKFDVWAHWPEHDRHERTADAFWNEAHADWQLGQYRARQFLCPPTVTHWMPRPSAPGAEKVPLTELIERSKTWLASLTPEQREEHFRLQREGYVKSELAWGDEGTRVSPAPQGDR